jgi:hypothetical protein
MEAVDNLFLRADCDDGYGDGSQDVIICNVSWDDGLVTLCPC